MKKYTIIATGLLMIWGNAALAMSGAQIAQAYEKGIEDTFYREFQDKDSFFYFLSETMTPALISWCNKAAADMKVFVSNNSKNLFGIKDSLLNSTAAGFEKLHLDTVNAIKIAKVVCLSSKPAREDLIQQYNIFEKTLKPQCANLITKLTQEKFTITEKKQSQELLMRVLTKLKGLIELAQDGIKYKIDHP